MSAAADLFTTAPLDDLRPLAAELTTALSMHPETWEWLDSTTFVSASTAAGRRVVVGTLGGWRTVAHPDTGTGQVSEPWASAAEAVAALDKETTA